jgi:raffinose/stachyose/melibiose transport system permease protein
MNNYGSSTQAPARTGPSVAVGRTSRRPDHPPGSSRPVRRAPRLGRRLGPYLYLVPGLAVVVGILYFGIGYNAYVSLLEWSGLGTDRTFVGLQNYRDILVDETFWLAMRHSAVFAAVTIVAQMILGLAFALLLHTRVALATVYKIIVFLPVVLAPAVMAPTFRRLFDANDGDLNRLLGAVGLGGLQGDWFADPDMALYCLAAVNVWQWTGFSFILYYAALTLLDRSIFQAARIDGAGPVRMIWSIVLPLLRGTHWTLLILGVVGVLKTFDIVFLITAGGPGQETEMLPTYIYDQAVTQFHAGYSAALSVVLLLVSLAVTLLQMRAYRKVNL